MIVRINWKAMEGSNGYHVHECKDYLVETLAWKESSKDKGEASQVFLLLDGVQDISLSNGDIAYIMNDDGKTIDTIKTA